MKKIILIAIIAFSALLAGCQASKTNADSDADPNTDSAEGVETANGIVPIEAELTIATFLQDSYLTYVATEYMALHPEIRVTVNQYSSEEERDLSKYQQTVNTAMIGGGGEDIIDLSKLNWTRLADKGMLLDLNEGLSLEEENYYMKVLDGFMYNGQRIGLPLNFIFEGFAFNDMTAAETATELTLEQMRTLVEKYPGIALFSGGGNGMSAERLAIEHFYRNMDTFMDVKGKTINMNDGQFEAILTEIKAITEQIDQDGRLDIYDPGAPYLMEQYMIYSPTMSSAGLIDLSGVFPLSYDGGQTYQTSGFLPAINANTKQRELAFDFLQFMVSKEMMMSPEQLFCTVNRNAVAEKAALEYESTLAGGYAPEGFDEEDLENNLLFFDQLAAKANILEYSDPQVSDFLYEDLGEFFQGAIGAKEACDRLQSKLGMYLNE